VNSTDESRALLVCAGGGIGDSLLASPVARALHERYATVDALTLPAHRETLDRVPDFDRVLVDDGADENTLAASIGERRYAAAVVTWATARSARIVRHAGIPVRVGQARRLYSGYFTNRVLVRSERGDVTTHWTQILLDYARALDCDTPDARPRFVPTEEDESRAVALMTRWQVEPERFFILHPSNAIASGVRWPLRGWTQVAHALYEHFALPIVVTGSGAESTIVESICGALPPGRIAIPAANATSIGSFAALARRSRAFIGITTGAMHVAAATGCPVIGIFPFQSDFPERWAPLADKTAILRATYPCPRRDTKERCSAGYACIEHLDAARIRSAVERLLQ
jgi:ADP-heptose:LPS heptosyltransferase